MIKKTCSLVGVFIFFFSFIPRIVLIQATNTYDGYYKGQAELSNVKMQVSGTVTVENSQFTQSIEKKINYAMGEREIPVGIEINIQGLIDGKGTVTGYAGGTGYVGVGDESATWSFKSNIEGKIKDNTLTYSFHVVPSVTKCPNEGAEKVTCSADPFDVSATYTRGDSSVDPSDSTHEETIQSEMTDTSIPTISKVMGDVEIINPDTREQYGVFEMTKDFVLGTLGYKSQRQVGAWGEGKKGMELPVNSQIKTGVGRAIIEFADGTKFIIREHSSFRVFNGGFELERGAFHMTFVKQANGQIILKDKRALFGIRGTQFLVEIGEQNTILTVFEGLVEASTIDKKIKQEVSGGQSVTIESNTIRNNNSQHIQNLQETWDAIGEEVNTNSSKVSAESFSFPTMASGFILGVVFVLGVVIMFKNRIIGAVLMVVSIGLGGYLIGAGQKPPTTTQVQPTGTPKRIATITQALPIREQTSSKSEAKDNWKTYTNKELGFTLEYPEGVKPETYNDGTLVLSQWGPTQKEDTEFLTV